jgi:hypothetical protein
MNIAKTLSRTLLSTILISSLVLTPFAHSAYAQGTPSQIPVEKIKAQPRLLTIIMQDIESRYQGIAKSRAKTLLSSVDSKKSAQTEKELGLLIEDLNSGKVSIENVKSQMISHNIVSTKEMKRLLLNQLRSMPSQRLNKFIQAVKANPAYSRATEKLDMAYTNNEKVNIIKDVLYQDLDQSMMASIKKIHWLNTKGMSDDLKRVQKQYTATKGDSKKLLRMLLIGAAVIAAAGLISYGIANSSYKNQYKAREKVVKSAYDSKAKAYANELAALKAELLAERNQLNGELQAQYNQLVAELQAQQQELTQTLTAQENQHLQDNGYVRMVCNSYTVPNSTLCNRYNYNMFNGSTTCTVMCMKNIDTGRETLHELPQCASPFIPADCFSQAMYQAEQTQGYNAGYSEGTVDGGVVGSQDGAYDGNANGSEDGYNDGYNDGYDYGYDSTYDNGFDNGWYDGYDDGFRDRYTEGYEDGYNTGYADGYDDFYVPPPEDDGGEWDDGWSDDDDWGSLGIRTLQHGNVSAFTQASHMTSMKTLSATNSMTQILSTVSLGSQGKLFSKGYLHGIRDARIMKKLK